MRDFREILNESDSGGNIQYAVLLLGGSIGSNPISSTREVKGKSVPEKDKLFATEKEAKEKAKRMNKLLSPGEKKTYRLNYVTVKVVDGKYA